MKSLVFTVLTLALSVQLFATHYQQEGTTGDLKSVYTIIDASLMKAPVMNSEGRVQFTANRSELKDKEGQLFKSGLHEYLSASGKTHNIAKLFETYDRRAKNANGDIKFKTQHDADVVCVLAKSGDNYTVDIYTGQDALDYMNGKK